MRSRASIGLLAITTLVSAAFVVTCVKALAKDEQAPNQIWLETLNRFAVAQDWGIAQGAQSVDQHPLKVGGKEFNHGIGTHAESEMIIHLSGSATRFTASVGIDDEVGKKGSAVFTVVVDGRPAYSSTLLRGGDSAEVLNVDLTDAKTLELIVTDGGDNIDCDHADWADAAITLAADATAKPIAHIVVDDVVPEIASGDPPAPAIHGARIVGTTPGRPFLYKVPYTGQGDVTVTATGLPQGLSIDNFGVITGSVVTAGEYSVELAAASSLGKCTRKLKIVAGDHKLALTPPMGWNSWNVWAGAVDAQKVRDAADWMIKSGLGAKGFSYINIDDTWEAAQRAPGGQITTNEKFGDMKALAAYVHSKGLKVGIYSSPGPKTCGGFLGSYEHEDQDAGVWAGWDMDYVKYDWCSYGDIEKRSTLEAFARPYTVMRHALDKTDRDIVYSLCQYGLGDVWKWGGSDEVGGNLWRTSGDIGDYWSSMSTNGFGAEAMGRYARPGHWNDPDMLVVGKLGWGLAIHESRLTPNEQITHITLWCMEAAPLLIGCDMSQMSKFTTDLLTNDEVLDVNQDPLGIAAVRVETANRAEVWARPLFDGTIAVAMFNRGITPVKVSAKWADVNRMLQQQPGLTGEQKVRDLWTHKDLGVSDRYETVIARHGAVLLKVGTAKNND